MGVILHRGLHVEVSRVLNLIKPSPGSCEKEKARQRLRAVFTGTLKGKSNLESAFEMENRAQSLPVFRVECTEPAPAISNGIGCGALQGSCNTSQMLF